MHGDRRGGEDRQLGDQPLRAVGRDDRDGVARVDAARDETMGDVPDLGRFVNLSVVRGLAR